MATDLPAPPGPPTSASLPPPTAAQPARQEPGTGTGSGTGSSAGTPASGSVGSGGSTAAPPIGASTAPPTGASAITALRPKVLRAAWTSVALGLLIELLLLAVATLGGKLFNAGPVVAELAQKVTWSVLVCVGIAFGTAATKARGPVMGLLGLASAPLAFNVAKAVHKGVSSALSAAAVVAPGPAPILLALLKSVEYGFLGAAVGWVGRRPRAGLAAYAGAGAAIGLTLGTLTLLVLSHDDGAATSGATLLARGINEILFPLGCSLVLYAADRIGKQAAG
jgi:hypothetical protein